MEEAAEVKAPGERSKLITQPLLLVAATLARADCSTRNEMEEEEEALSLALHRRRVRDVVWPHVALVSRASRKLAAARAARFVVNELLGATGRRAPVAPAPAALFA